MFHRRAHGIGRVVPRLRPLLALHPRRVLDPVRPRPEQPHVRARLADPARACGLSLMVAAGLRLCRGQMAVAPPDGQIAAALVARPHPRFGRCRSACACSLVMMAQFQSGGGSAHSRYLFPFLPVIGCFVALAWACLPGNRRGVLSAAALVASVALAVDLLHRFLVAVVGDHGWVGTEHHTLSVALPGSPVVLTLLALTSSRPGSQPTVWVLITLPGEQLLRRPRADGDAAMLSSDPSLDRVAEADQIGGELTEQCSPRVGRAPVSSTGDGRHHRRPRGPRAQPPQRHARAAARQADRLHRAVRLGQVVAGVRHHLRRGPAALRRVAVAYARQFLGQMDKPDVDFIEGLSPAISIDQKSASRNPRSTVGTITEVYDYLRLLYARIGVPHCPERRHGSSRARPPADRRPVLELPEGTRFQVLAPVVRGRKGEYDTLLDDLAAQGFARARIDGEIDDLAGPELELGPLRAAHDRGRRRPAGAPRGHRAPAHRLARDGAEAGRGRGRGRDRPARTARATPRPRRSRSPAPRVPGRAARRYEELAPRNFSFNSPYGACEHATASAPGSRSTRS